MTTTEKNIKCKNTILLEGVPLGLVANVLDCDIKVSEFDLQSRY